MTELLELAILLAGHGLLWVALTFGAEGDPYALDKTTTTVETVATQGEPQ